MVAGIPCDVTVTPAMECNHDSRSLPVRPLPPIPPRIGLPCVLFHISSSISNYFSVTQQQHRFTTGARTAPDLHFQFLNVNGPLSYLTRPIQINPGCDPDHILGPGFLLLRRPTSPAQRPRDPGLCHSPRGARLATLQNNPLRLSHSNQTILAPTPTVVMVSYSSPAPWYREQQPFLRPLIQTITAASASPGV